MTWLGFLLMTFGSFFTLMMVFWGISLLLYVYLEKRKAAQQEEPMHPFKAGDMVILGERNPHKGSLVCGKPYEVVGTSRYGIWLGAENKTIGHFSASHFQLYTGLGRIMPGDGHKEYEEAIAAQEAMDEITSR